MSTSGRPKRDLLAIARGVVDEYERDAQDIGFLARPDGAALAVVALGVRAHQHAAPEGAVEAHLVPAGVQAAPAPVVVGVVGVGGDDE